MDIKSEVLKDFKASLDGIDFTSYNPSSREFQNALDLGLMWKLLCWSENKEPAEEIEARSIESDDILDELNGAKMYLQKYLDTNDETYKQMASDELHHADILIKKEYAKMPSPSERVRLRNYEGIHNDVMDRIKKN